jgi:predicted transcriptional regulator
LPRPKRSKMEIYNDILTAIRAESTDGEPRPTRIQAKSNLAYDKLMRYLGELEGRELIVQDPLQITGRGRDFLEDYRRIQGFLKEMGVKYLADSWSVAR